MLRSLLNALNKGRQQRAAFINSRTAVSESLFEQRHIGIPPGTASNERHQSAIRAPSASPHVYKRSQQFHFSVAEMPALKVDVGPMCFMSITGTETSSYSLALHSEIAAADEGQANALFQQLTLVQDNETLALKTPQNSSNAQSRVYLNVTSPCERPVIVTGSCAAVEVIGIRASVSASTSHGNLSLFDNVGPIDASAREGGWIVFTGKGGCTRLRAEGEINVKITNPSYDGTLEAYAEGPIRVLLPHAFASPFEIKVRNRSQFVCKAGLASQFTFRREAGRTVVTYGVGEPKLLFVSSQGPVVLDMNK